MTEKRRDQKGRILRNGEVQREDGKYMFRYVDPHSGTRKTIYSWKLVETDKLPEGKRPCVALRDLERSIQKDIDDDIRRTDAEKLCVNDLFSRFFDTRKDLRTATRCTYQRMYNAHIKDVLGERKLKSVKNSDIKKLYYSLVVDKGLNVSSVEKINALLYQMFDMAFVDSIIRYNPATGALKSVRKTCEWKGPEKRHALSVREQEIFVHYVYHEPRFQRLGPLFSVLLGTGMRIGEALGLRWCDCNFEENTINIDHALLYKEDETGKCSYRISKTKTSAGIREIPMFQSVKQVLLEYKKSYKKSNFKVDGYSGFIFLNSKGNAFTATYIFDALQNIVSSYNHDEYFSAKNEGRKPEFLPKISSHILRHTFCTRLCENAPDVSSMKSIQDVMGHKHIRTTMDVYSDATKQKKQECFQKMEENFPSIRTPI